MNAAVFNAPFSREAAAGNEGAEWWIDCVNAWQHGPIEFFSNIDQWFAADQIMVTPNGQTVKGLPNVLKSFQAYFQCFKENNHQMESFVIWQTDDGYMIYETATEFYNFHEGNGKSTGASLDAPGTWKTIFNVQDRDGKTWDCAIPAFFKRKITRKDGKLKADYMEGIYNEEPMAWLAAQRGLTWPGTTPFVEN